MYQNQKKNQAKNLTGSEAIKIAERLNLLLHGNSSIDQQANRFDSQYGTILFDEIRQVIDTMGKVNYTFRVDHPESSDEKFFNLVLQEKDNYSTVKLYKYEMTQEFAQFYKQSLSLSRFTGTITTTTIETNIPCPENDFIVVVAPNPVNTGGGSDLPPNGNPNITYPDTGNIGNPYYGNVTTPSSSSGSSSGSGGGTATVSMAPEDEEEDEWIEVSQSPRYFRLAVQSTINTNPNEPCNTQLIIGILSPIDECSKDFMDNLPYDQKEWLYIQQNNNLQLFSEIIDYISFEGNGCSEDKNDFIESIIPQIRDNPDVFTSIKPFLIEKEIDDSQLDPCSKSIFHQIKNTSNADFAQILGKLGANNSVYNVLVKTVDTPNGSPGNTKWDSPYNYTVTLDPDYPNATKLGRASILFHELVHTYFMSLFDDYHNGIPANPNAYDNFAILYQKYVDKTFPGSSSVAHHAQMASTYVNAIALALQEYQTGLAIPNGTQPQQVYIDLAWGGLQEAPIFNEPTGPLSTSDRERIVNRYNCEMVGHAVLIGTPQQQIPAGQPCN